MKHKFRINESGAVVAAVSGMWNHPVKKENLMTPPHQIFSFSHSTNYPLGREVHIWKEGIYTCILFSSATTNQTSYLVAVGGIETKSETSHSAKFLIKNLDWVFSKQESQSDTIREVNSIIRYEAEKIKLEGGLLNSGFPKGWKLDISSKTFSPNEIIQNLKK